MAQASAAHGPGRTHQRKSRPGYALLPVSRRHRRPRRQHLHRLRHHSERRLPADGGCPFRALDRRGLQAAPPIAAAVCCPIRRQRQMNSLMGVISTGFAQTQRGGGMGMRPGRFATSGQSPLGPSRGTLVLHSAFPVRRRGRVRAGGKAEIGKAVHPPQSRYGGRESRNSKAEGAAVSGWLLPRMRFTLPAHQKGRIMRGRRRFEPIRRGHRTDWGGQRPAET